MLFFFKYNVRTQKEQSVNFKVGLEKSRFLPWVSSPNFMKKKLTWRRKQPPLKLRRFLCIKVKWKQEGPTTNWSGPNKYVLRMRWRFSPKKKEKENEMEMEMEMDILLKLLYTCTHSPTIQNCHLFRLFMLHAWYGYHNPSTLAIIIKIIIDYSESFIRYLWYKLFMFK